jgi:hypothetical protein
MLGDCRESGCVVALLGQQVEVIELRRGRKLFVEPDDARAAIGKQPVSEWAILNHVVACRVHLLPVKGGSRFRIYQLQSYLMPITSQ